MVNKCNFCGESTERKPLKDNCGLCDSCYNHHEREEKYLIIEHKIENLRLKEMEIAQEIIELENKLRE